MKGFTDRVRIGQAECWGTGWEYNKKMNMINILENWRGFGDFNFWRL